jgi:hypothetical protein
MLSREDLQHVIDEFRQVFYLFYFSFALQAPVFAYLHMLIDMNQKSSIVLFQWQNLNILVDQF